VERKTDLSEKSPDRHRQGKTKETFIYEVRKRYTVDGREREKKRRSESYTEILELKKEIEDEIARELAGDGPSPDRKFSELLTYFNDNYAVPAEYAGDVKVKATNQSTPWKGS